MASSSGREEALVRLRADVRRYRAASEAALDQIDWVIGYLERDRRNALARDLRRNRAAIVRALRQDRRRQ
jgi:hypothetical protein